MNSYLSTLPFLSRARRESGHRARIGDQSRLQHSLSSKLKAHHTWDPKMTVDHTDHGGVFNFDFSPDGSLLGVACERKSVLLFDPFNGKLVAHKMKAHTDCVNCVKFLDNRLFATCSDDTTVALWDTRYLKHSIHVYRGHSNWVKNIEYARNEGTLVTSGFDGCIYTWNINRYSEDEEISSRVFYSSSLMRSKLTPDASKLLISNYEGYIIVIHNLDLSTLKQDLAGFKPTNYRLMQQSRTPLRIGLMYNHVFERERNRVEFLSDWPMGDDANAISSLQVHPQGWCAVSRNIDSTEKGEWTCVHNIQDYDYKPRPQEHGYDMSDVTPHTSSSYCSSTNTPAFSSVAPSNGRRNSLSSSQDNHQSSPESSREPRNQTADDGSQSPRQHSMETGNSENINEPNEVDTHMNSVTELTREGSASVNDTESVNSTSIHDTVSVDSSSVHNTEIVNNTSVDQPSDTSSPKAGTSDTTNTSQTTASGSCTGSNSEDSHMETSVNSESVRENSPSLTNSVDTNRTGENLVNSVDEHNSLHNSQENIHPVDSTTSPDLSDNQNTITTNGGSSATNTAPLLDSSRAPAEEPTPGLGRTHDSLIQIRRGQRQPDGHFSYSISVHTADGRTIEFDDTDLESDEEDTNPMLHLLNPSGQDIRVHMGPPGQRDTGDSSPTHEEPSVNDNHISDSESVEEGSFSEHEDDDDHFMLPNEPLEEIDSSDEESVEDLDRDFNVRSMHQELDARELDSDHNQPLNSIEDDHRFMNTRVLLNATSDNEDFQETLNNVGELVTNRAIESDSESESSREATMAAQNRTEVIPLATNNNNNNHELDTNNTNQSGNPTRSNSFTFVLHSNSGQRFLNLRYMDSYTESENVRLRDKIHTNSKRLLGYAEECNVGRGFIKELGFSADGRLISSPFGFGVRLFGFNSNCDELCDCVPTSPVKLYEVTTSLAHGNYVVATKFSPTHNMVISGCLDGKIVFHQPVL